MIFISPALLILAKDATTMMARSSSLALALCLLAAHPAAAQEGVQAFSSAQAVSQTVPFPTMSWEKSLPVTSANQSVILAVTPAPKLAVGMTAQTTGSDRSPSMSASL